MCNGLLFGKLIIFAVPLMLSGILQRLFNAADSMIVGQFAGKEAFAAVGSTGSLSSLLIDLFIGLSVGVNVLAAYYYGAGNKKELTETVRTSLATALICGIFLSVIGMLFADPLLRLMDTPEDILDKAVLYMRIYFCSMPAMLLYNFGSALLRAFGDTRHPFCYLLTAGLLKIVLSLILVIGFKRNVDGVALATVLSQFISAILVVRCLIFLRLRCHSRQFRRQHFGGLCLHLHERPLSDRHMLYRSELRRTQLQENQKNITVLPTDSHCNGLCAW